jgi:hypothetical protein
MHNNSFTEIYCAFLIAIRAEIRFFSFSSLACDKSAYQPARGSRPAAEAREKTREK